MRRSSTRRGARLGALAVALALYAASSGTSSARADHVEHRAIPDYDGREPRPPDVDDALLWIPRIVTGPLYLLSEYVIRVPLGALVTLAERERWVQWAQSFFVFGPTRNIGIFPTAFFDFGFLPSVGLYSYWDSFLTDHNRISVHAATWGSDWLSLSVRDQVTLGSTSVYLRGAYLRRPDLALNAGNFYPGADVLVRYAAESVDTELGYSMQPGLDRSFFGASLGARWARFAETPYADQLSIVTIAAEHGLPLPSAFQEGYAVATIRLRGAIDTRDVTGAPSAGFRLAAHGELDRWMREPGPSTWFLLGGQLLVATDFAGGRRVFSLALDLSTILTQASFPPPFDLTIDLGGIGPLTGFWGGQVRGLSGAALTLAYEWPVWLLLSARLYVATGGAFGQAFEGLALERMRLSFGLAIRMTGAGEHPFELGIGAGTDPFDRDASISTFRFYFGARNNL